MAKRKKAPKQVETLKHGEASRRNIPTAELQSVMEKEDLSPVAVAYARRNRDLDPQLVWRGKDEQDEGDLEVQAPPLFIQEKVHPKALIDDLMAHTKEAEDDGGGQLDLFADFNGVPEGEAKTEFYRHEGNWSNRMILGDSLQVMASLAEREGLRGKVQCIYLDPPYGIKFNSNFQWSTTSRDVKDGKAEHITREPEQVKAFRDTWRDGIHSYLTYLRDRLVVARDLLTDSGSVFVQIGDENVHRVRALMDEVFGEENFVCLITLQKTGGQSAQHLASVADYIVWYAKHIEDLKYRQLYQPKGIETDSAGVYTRVQLPDGERRRMTTQERRWPDQLPDGSRIFRVDNATSTGFSERLSADIWLHSSYYTCGNNKHWKTHPEGMNRLIAAERLAPAGKSLGYIRFIDDFAVYPHVNMWLDTGTGSFTDDKVYVVQTGTKTVERCLLMATNPGDLVLDPTCGSGTTAYVAEQWGRRWITIDTSRVALALARARIMGARYPYYLLADSPEGQRKEAELSRREPSTAPTHNDIRQGFVYERVPHIMLKTIANNAEIDVIWDTFQARLEPLRESLNKALGQTWEEWQIPREAEDAWPKEAKKLHAEWWRERLARQREIDASIAAKADYEYLYDQPHDDKGTVRVAGPFTVESLSPHRVLTVGEDGNVIDRDRRAQIEDRQDFASLILQNLETAGVQQAHKEDKITFTSLVPWPGEYICAEGRYREGNKENAPERRAGILIGPEFGTVAKQDLVDAAREAGEADFDVLIACAFNYDAHASDYQKLGRIHILKARMNADLHMAEDLKNTGKGNLFVIFGEPEIEIRRAGPENGGKENQILVEVKGVDVFHPNTGEIRSDGPEGIACWLLDTDYNSESFFVRHAYFLGANDPYKALKTTLKAEINREAWETLHGAVSRPFDVPASGRIAVKVINHLGDEVMRVFRVEDAETGA